MKLPVVLSDGFLKAMPAAERKKLGKAGVTSAEAQAKFAAGQEKELQDQIAVDLFRRGIYFTRSRMDKRTTTKKGTPDFIICVNGLFLGVECKVEGGVLSKEQAHEGSKIQYSGGKFIIAYSLQDVNEAIRDLL